MDRLDILRSAWLDIGVGTSSVYNGRSDWNEETVQPAAFSPCMMLAATLIGSHVRLPENIFIPLLEPSPSALPSKRRFVPTPKLKSSSSFLPTPPVAVADLTTDDAERGVCGGDTRACESGLTSCCVELAFRLKGFENGRDGVEVGSGLTSAENRSRVGDGGLFRPL